MIKGTKGLMLLSVSLFLSGCGFNEEEALEQSTDQLESFLTLHEERERVSDLDNDDLLSHLEEDVFPYLTENYQETISDKVKDYDFNEKLDLGKDIFFLDESSKEYNNGLFWQTFSIKESNVDLENESINYSISLDELSLVIPNNLNIEMVEENGDWKLNSVSELEE